MYKFTEFLFYCILERKGVTWNVVAFTLYTIVRPQILH